MSFRFRRTIYDKTAADLMHRTIRTFKDAAAVCQGGNTCFKCSDNLIGQKAILIISAFFIYTQDMMNSFFYAVALSSETKNSDITPFC